MVSKKNNDAIRDEVTDDLANDCDEKALRGSSPNGEEDKDSDSSYDEGQSYSQGMLDTTDTELIK